MRIVLFILALIISSSSSYAGYHTVQIGESYASIARLYDVPLDSLVKANHAKKPFAGLAIKVPLSTLIFDMGCNNLFRVLSRGIGANNDRGLRMYKKAFKKQNNLSSYVGDKRISAEQDIVNWYEKAISYGNLDALYQLGRYKIHGQFYANHIRPSFKLQVNSNLEEFKQGMEYLQIAAVLAKNDKAAVELAVACGQKSSPIYNPYLCLNLLEDFTLNLSIPVDYLLCYMYEYGYGVNRDYMKAYIYATGSRLVTKGAEVTYREQILDQIDTLPLNFESAKYGVGLTDKILLTIACSHYTNDRMDPEGIFYLHRAARMKNAEANWMMAGILKNKLYDRSYFHGSDEEVLCFARAASDLGNEEATAYVSAYEEYLRKKRQREAEEELQRMREERERKERRRENWLNAVGTLAMTVANTYVAAETYKQNANMQGNMSGNLSGYSFPQNTPILQMTDAQFEAKNQLAMQQIAQYTFNKTMADWTGGPMQPTDMSAVDLGTDNSPGSALWMWNQQQSINTTNSQYLKMNLEKRYFFKQQADAIERHLIERPFDPIPGYYNADGEWVSREEVIAGRELEEEKSGKTVEQKLPGESAVEKIRSYNKDNYGYKTCKPCRGTGVCQTCNGKGWYYPDSFGIRYALECPNCPVVNGKRSGKCSYCGGRGQVFGRKY